jgi:hypothetical protein
VSGDDAVELWLSLDDQAETKQRICYTSSFTSLTDWEKYQSQRSPPVRLIGGRKYYIEALLKQAGSFWAGRSMDGTRPPRQIIPGAYLSPVNEDPLSAASGR